MAAYITAHAQEGLPPRSKAPPYTCSMGCSDFWALLMDASDAF